MISYSFRYIGSPASAIVRTGMELCKTRSDDIINWKTDNQINLYLTGL